MIDAELLDERVIFQRGCLQRVRRWWRGIHPGKGTITRGRAGWETVEEKDRIVPAGAFTATED
jgi:hypothetical protein